MQINRLGIINEVKATCRIWSIFLKKEVGSEDNKLPEKKLNENEIFGKNYLEIDDDYREEVEIEESQRKKLIKKIYTI